MADPERLGGLFLDDYTFRMAATLFRKRFHPAAGERIDGHADRPASGRLTKLSTNTDAPAAITLVVLSRSDDMNLGRLLDEIAPHFAATLVVVDQAEGAGKIMAGRNGVTLLSVPLQGFDRSRNAAQTMAQTQWTIHLDTDETLPPELIGALPALVRMADEAGLDAIGFPRRNLVEGALADLYPDVQYRLVRRSVRFEGPVHERPDACHDWTRTMICLAGAIEHRLSAGRVLARRARYDGLGQDAGRSAEADALLAPYSP